ncbi:MAG TPA: hypothetical protein VD767_00225 [Thermomicrobiales bacterium]|nr:hypothetical protein [Thermomicrobiales bacterium]
MPLAIARTRVIICLLFLVSLAPFINSPATAQPAGSLPILASAVTTLPPVDLLVVRGSGFSPGGLVAIVVYDRWGTGAYAPEMTTASTAQYGPHGSTDPARGYVAAGSLNLVVGLGSPEVFGPNGSADPARGYDSGTETVASALSCDQELMVRAYDYRTKTWTNLVDIAAAC